MNDPIVGYWHKVKTRCDYCNKARDQIYVVKDGPTTGKFCSTNHYLAARQHMEQSNDEKTSV